ncbi:MAG: hypothetical protein P8046_11585, partial [Anaerolineales bacterium]
MNTHRNTQFLRWGTLLVTLVSAAGVAAFSQHIQAEGWLQLSRGLQFSRWLGWGGVALLALLSGYAWLGGAECISQWLTGAVARLSRLHWLMLPVLVALLVVFPVLVMGHFQVYLVQNWTRHAVFMWLALLTTLVWQSLWKKVWWETLMASALSMAVVYHLATYFPNVTNYPFTLWWSETSRYYLGSTFFAERLYGKAVPWSFRDLTRYLMQAAPFLIPNSTLWLSRLWQVILRFTMGYFTGMIFARKLKISPGWPFWAFTAWAGLYFFQGPVFYNLIVIVMLAVWLVDEKRFWKTLLVVAGVSVYAGFSRINWVPMPGLIAAAYYFLRRSVRGRDLNSVVRYLAAPAVWVLVGVVVGLGAQNYWATNSGNPPEIYYSSFTSYLLWKRLFPNPSYAMGILPSILLVTAPLLIFLGLGVVRRWKNWHFVRILALVGMTAALGAGGLLVSVKIGGGTNLHNMDVYLVILLIIVLDLYFGFAVDGEGQPFRVGMHVWLKAAVVAMPVLFVVTYTGQNFLQWDRQAAQRDLVQIQQYVDQASAGGGEVLFITQRHLITFGYIQNVELVHAHEKILLQEMAMSQNEVYLDHFGAELAA